MYYLKLPRNRSAVGTLTFHLCLPPSIPKADTTLSLNIAVYFFKYIHSNKHAQTGLSGPENKNKIENPELQRSSFLTLMFRKCSIKIY